ncbi:MAG: NfeD family protein [Dehalococcoidia bacterium]|nr:NfeD family protein [Dehalococcoidia bacterium]
MSNISREGSRLVNIRWILLDAVLGGVLKQVALLVVAFWGLPLFGYYLPLWVVVILGLALAVQSGFSCMLAVRLSKRRPLTGPETMVGKRCIAVTPLDPAGYVKIDGELWRAVVVSGKLGVGEEAVVVSVKDMTLVVSGDNPDRG